MDNFEVENLPRWIHKTTDCLWCGKDAELYCVRQVKDAVQCWYACNNEQCEFERRFGKQHTQGINLTGGYVESYKKHLEAEAKAKENRPEDTKDMKVPAEVKAG